MATVVGWITRELRTCNKPEPSQLVLVLFHTNITSAIRIYYLFRSASDRAWCDLGLRMAEALILSRMKDQGATSLWEPESAFGSSVPLMDETSMSVLFTVQAAYCYLNGTILYQRIL